MKETHGIKGFLINNGLKSKAEKLHDSGKYTSSIYDSIVFSKVREKFGGNIRVMVTGSAPITKEAF